MPLRHTTSLLIALALAAAPARAQNGNGGSHSTPEAEVATVHALADSLYYGGQPEEAWESLRTHLEREPEDYEALWRAARSALVLAVATDGNRAQNAWLDPGRALAQRAVEVRPEGVEGLYFRAALTGRRAMNASPGYAVELAQLTWEDANRVLELDPQHGGAHNVLGKLNYEVMILSRVQRFIARTFMGNDVLRDAGWEQAEEHLTRAAELWPELVLFHYDLAALYERRGREEEAAVAIQRALELPVLHPPDERFKRQAEELLSEINR